MVALAAGLVLGPLDAPLPKITDAALKDADKPEEKDERAGLVQKVLETNVGNYYLAFFYLFSEESKGWRCDIQFNERDWTLRCHISLGQLIYEFHVPTKDGHKPKIPYEVNQLVKVSLRNLNDRAVKPDRI